MFRRRALVLSAAFAIVFANPVPAQMLEPLPAVPTPSENPITEAKAVLGKILFWDQQLSTDNTIACGTCHAPSAGGMDPTLAVHPGADGVFGNADDVIGSFGVVRRDAEGTPVEDAVFGFDVQVTGRAAPNFFGGLWGPAFFWDGRAGDAFFDPVTGEEVISGGGGLESQALGPILSDVEMAKEGRTWAEVVTRLEFAPPLALASDWPADVTDAIAADPTYPDLFDAAFGDPEITPVRIAFAIATYERVLVADETPFDAFVAGDASALSATEQAGLQFFVGSPCAVCHAPPTFTDDSFRTLGVREPAQDTGRAAVTGVAADRGAFKVPTLRNVGLKPSFMHTGEFTTLDDVVTFYQPGNQDQENLDPLMPVAVPPNARAALLAFLDGALTDPRVANETDVFSRPIPAPEPGVAPGLVAGLLGAAALARRRRDAS
ncbi:MAG: cytochrome c peroxidase [Myxococcota bacterium]